MHVVLLVEGYLAITKCKRITTISLLRPKLVAAMIVTNCISATSTFDPVELGQQCSVPCVLLVCTAT